MKFRSLVELETSRADCARAKSSFRWEWLEYSAAPKDWY